MEPIEQRLLLAGDLAALEIGGEVDGPVTNVNSLPEFSNNKSIALSWGGTDATGIATYTVFVSENGGAFSALLMDTPLTSTTFTAAEGKTYRFYCVGTDTLGNAEVKSAVAEATTTVDTIAPVAALTPLPEFINQTTFLVSWGATDATSGVQDYTIFLKDNGTFVNNFRTRSTDTSGMFTGVAGRSYSFRVVAFDRASNTSPNEFEFEIRTRIDTTAPTSTLNATEAAINTATADLSWSGTDELNGSGVSSYSVFASENGGAFAAVVSNTTQTTASIPVNDGSTYRFFVVARDGAGNIENKATAEATVVVDRTPPTAAVNALPAFSAGTQIPVSWSGTDGAGVGGVSYLLYVSTSGGPFTQTGGLTPGTSTLFSAEDGKAYSFFVVAQDALGNQGTLKTAGDTTTVVDAFAPESRVSVLPPTAEGTTFTLTWSGTDLGDSGETGSGVASYALFVSTNGGAFTQFGQPTTQTSTSFTGVDGSRYAFYTVATDFAGNIEAAPSSGDASTRVGIDTPLLVEAGIEGAGTNLIFSPVKLRLPKAINGAIVGGTTIKGTVKVKNAGGTLATGLLGVELYLSDDGTVSSKDVLLGRVDVRRAIKLKANATVSVPFSVVLPSNYTGTGNLLAWANRPGDGGALAVAETTTADNVFGLAQFQVAPPVLNLTASTLTVRTTKLGKKNTATLLVTNNSNVAFKDTLSVLTSLLDGQGGTLSEATLTRRVAVAIGKSIKLTVSYVGPAETGSFSLRSRIDPQNVLGQSTVDDTTSAALTRLV